MRRIAPILLALAALAAPASAGAATHTENARLGHRQFEAFHGGMVT